MRKILLIALCLTFAIGCEESKIQILQRRLDNFRNILPPELKQQFDSKNYQAVVAGIDSLLENAPEFKKRYQRLKHEELIDVFSPQEVVDFFREHFVEKIERLKLKKERNW